MRLEIIYGQTMRIMSECIVRFGNCGRSFISPAIYKSVSAKRIVISGPVLRASSNFRSVSTNDVYLLRIPLWVH